MRNPLSPWVRGLAGCLLAIAAVACGDDVVEPTLPDVSGLYVDTTTISALTCTDTSFNRPGFTTTALERAEQHGAEVTLRLLEVEGQNVEHLGLTVSFTLDREGRFQLEQPPSPWEEVVTPAGSVYIQSRGAGSGQFLWTAQPITLTGAGTVTEVYRQGSATGPVLATCTMQQTNSATWTGP